MPDIAWKALLILAVVGLVIQGIILAGALRELGALLLQVGPPRHGDVDEGPERGSLAEIDSLEGRPGLVVFLSPGCTLCPPVSRALPIAAKAFPEIQVIALVVNGEEAERRRYADSLGVAARTDQTRLFQTWTVPGTPYAVALDRRHRVVASGIVNNLPQVESMAELLRNMGEPIDGDTNASIDLTASALHLGRGLDHEFH